MVNNQVDILDTQFEKKLPEVLNVLTILTLVACVIGLISVWWGFTHAKASYEQMQQVNTHLQNLPGFVQNLVGTDALERSRKMYENRLLIMIFGIVDVVCCAFGSWKMRKLQRAGFFLWLVGKLLPLAAFNLIVGMVFMSGYIMKADLFITAVFIILYSTQYKHLVSASAQNN